MRWGTKSSGRSSVLRIGRRGIVSVALALPNQALHLTRRAFRLSGVHRSPRPPGR